MNTKFIIFVVERSSKSREYLISGLRAAHRVGWAWVCFLSNILCYSSSPRRILHFTWVASKAQSVLDKQSA